MKKTAEELGAMLKAHEEALGEDFLGLLEDIADSVAEAPEPSDPDPEKYIEKAKYDELRQKYVDRFMGGKPAEEKTPEEKKEPEQAPPAEPSIEDIVADY